MLSKHYKRDVAQEDMTILLDQYYSETKGADYSGKERSDVQHLKRMMYDFNQSQLVLQEIDVRKQQIAQEIDQTVNEINDHMKGKVTP